MASKRGTCFLTACVLTLALVMSCLPVQAETGKNGKWTVYYAKDVDLSGIAEKDGRLSGSVTTFRPKADPRVLRIDCPVPAEFTPEQLQAITVEYRKFNKTALADALNAVGTDPGKGKMEIYNDGWDQRGAVYRAEELLWPFTSNYFGRNMATGALNKEHPKYDQMACAARTASAFLKELGFVPYEDGLNVSRLYDPAVYGLMPQRSDWALLQEEFNKDYRKLLKKYIRTDVEYTVVGAAITMRGLPVYPEFYWPSGTAREPGAITGNSSRANIAIKDGGTIVDVSLSSLPVEKSAAPMAAPAHSWQEALKEWIATYFSDPSDPQDVTFTDADREREVTGYGTYSVLTEIKPVYMSNAQKVYAPAWCFVMERRLIKDDTYVDTWVNCLDAAALTNISMLAFN